MVYTTKQHVAIKKSELDFFYQLIRINFNKVMLNEKKRYRKVPIL